MKTLVDSTDLLGFEPAGADDEPSRSVSRGDPAQGAQSAPTGNDDPLFLELTALLPDPSGEVVLFAEPDMTLSLVTREPLIGLGISDQHVTGSGLEVTGLHFYSFESGITVYSPTDLLIIDDPAAL